MKITNEWQNLLTDHARKNLSILDAIKRNKDISRTEISRITGLNIVTVSNYVNSYIEKGLVIEKGLDISSGGRRPAIVELNPEYCYVIGVELGLRHVRAILTNLNSEIICSVEYERPRQGEKAVVEILYKCLHDLLAKSEKDVSKIKGMCVAASGVIDKEAGTVHCTFGIVSVYLPINELLEKEFGIPTMIENDATAAAYGEWSLGLGHVTDIKVLLYMYSGVGCGIITNGEIYEGASGTAGEPSVREVPDEAKPVWLDNRSPIAPWAIDLWICEDIKDAIQKGKQSKVKDLVDGKLDKINLKTVFAALREGDTLSKEIIEKAAKNLGIKISFLVNLFNPDMVVIGGGIEGGGAVIVDAVKETVRKYAFEEMSNVVRIIPARLGENGACLGASCLVVRRIFASI